jgi:spore coat polysaccharide biosynthesis predicted glycosyltransferase SpsG
MRCVTLGAELVKRGFRATLVGSDISGLPRHRAEVSGIRVTDLMAAPSGRDDAFGLVQINPDLVVIDGYSFAQEFFDEIDQHDIRYVVIDDNGELAPPKCQLLINQNPHADRDLYPGISTDRLLLGSNFALIREEVRRSLDFPTSRSCGIRPSVLVAIGGTDPKGLGEKIACRLSITSNVEVWAATAGTGSGVRQAPPDIAKLLSTVTLAVLGGGSSLWEACFLGTPTVAVVVADNQLPSAGSASETGATFAIDCRLSCDLDEICSAVARLLSDCDAMNEMIAIGKALVDGNGAIRVANAVQAVMAS